MRRAPGHLPEPVQAITGRRPRSWYRAQRFYQAWHQVQVADPELGNLNLSRGGQYPVKYALRLGAGFGSQIAMTLLRRIPGSGERLERREVYDRWLADLAGYERADLEVEQRTLRVHDKGPPAHQPAMFPDT